MAPLVDDPDNLNAFLNLIGAASYINAAMGPQASNEEPAGDGGDPTSSNKKTCTATKESVEEDTAVAAEETPLKSHSVEPSPLKGTKAPPPTPANKAVVSPDNATLNLDDEDQTNILTALADASTQTLAHSKHASTRGSRNYSPVSQFKAPTFREEQGLTSSTANVVSSKSLSPLQKDIVARKMALKGPVGDADFQAQVLAAQRHKLEQVDLSRKENIPLADHGTLTEPYGSHLLRQDTAGIKDKDSTPQPAEKVIITIHSPLLAKQGPKSDLENHDQTEEESSFVSDTPSRTKVPGEAHTRIKRLSSEPAEFVPRDASPWPTMTNSSRETHMTKDNKASEPGIGSTEKDGPEDAKTHLLEKVAGLGTRKTSTTNIKVTTHSSEDHEGREHQAYFSSWGTPTVRDKSRPQVRTIMLSRLPPTADLTLVQSLMSGGSVERMSLAGVSHTAHVVFTTGDACDSFFNKYPNGIDFKHNGKPCTVLVDKGKDVDIISGTLQGHLDCGASRVVRATGADGDWSMRALHVLAAGNKSTRRVESILDTYRNDIRTIVFRFASIADAVQFRGILLRDEDWESCNVQFVADPCEKATGVHLE